jgi:hypothetical protein
MNAVPIAMLLTGLITLASEMGLFKSETELANEQLELLNKTIEENQTLVKNIATRGAQKQDAEAMAFINEQRAKNNSELSIETALVEQLKKKNLELLDILQNKVYPAQLAFNAAKSNLDRLNSTGVDASGNIVASGNMSTIRNMYQQEFAAAESRLNQINQEITLLKQSGLSRADLIKRAQELMGVYKEQEGISGNLFEEETNYKKSVDNTNNSLKKRAEILDVVIEKEEDVRQLIDIPEATVYNPNEVDSGMDAYFEEEQAKRDLELQRIEQQIQLAEDLTNITTFLVDKRIEAIDREIEAEKKKEEASKQRVNEIIAMRQLDSNSLAQSLAFEKQEQAKALAEQEKLQRKKQRLELFNTAVNLMNSQIAQGNGEPLARTMADVSALMGFIRSLPMFWEGTDTTVGDAVGTKFSNGRDGILARVDKSEMILNKSKVDKLAAMGIHSTDEVVKRLMLGGGITNTPTSMVAMNDNSDVVNELAEHKALLKALVNKPTTSTTMEQMGSVVTIVEKMSSPKKSVETIRYKKVR